METNLQSNREDAEIDLIELGRVLLSKLGIIILSAVALALVAYLGTKLFLTPQYVSTTKMYVLTQQNTDTITNSDMLASAYLTKDYQELISSRQVTETVIAQLGLNMTHEQLVRKMTISTPEDTRVMSIRITDPDPYEAARIADAVRDVSAEHIRNVMNVESVNTVDQANIPTNPSSPNSTRYAMMGGLLGAVIAIAIILIGYMMNDSLKTSEDVERYLRLSTLGMIPLDEGEVKTKRKKRKHKRSKK